MRFLLFFLLLFLIGCASYRGGIAKEFPPKEFCFETQGEWKKVPKQDNPEDPYIGIFDVDKHPDYNHKCFCPPDTLWMNQGCQAP